MTEVVTPTEAPVQPPGWSRRIASGLGGIFSSLLWWAVGLWAALVLFYTAPGPGWLQWLLALGLVGLMIAAAREGFRFWQWPRRTWGEKKFSTLALAAIAAVGIYFVATATPNPNLVWSPEQAKMPVVTIEGDKVHVTNVRNFTWRTATDFTPGYYDRTYDLSKLNSMYYVVASMPAWEAVAHVFVCFGFIDGQSVAVSVEGRRQKGQPYQVFPSMFRQYQMIYVIGDERDVVGLRGAIWKKPTYMYPAATTNERKRAIFLDMMKRAESLEEHPEYYHLLTNNCMNNITYHMRRLGGRPLPHDLWLLMTGLSDRVAHQLGYLDTQLPFTAAREAFRVDRWMQTTPLDATFADKLRQTLQRQEAEAKAKQPTDSTTQTTAAGLNQKERETNEKAPEARDAGSTAP